MTAADLSKFEPVRRYATLLAMAVESMAMVTDEIIDLHDRIIGRLIRSGKTKQNQHTLASRSTVAAMMRIHSRLGDALFEAKDNGEDPFAAIETAVGWESVAESIAQSKELSRPPLEDHLALVSTPFTTLRRYTPAFLAVFELHGDPAAQDLLAAINVIRALNTTGARKVPDDAPVSFIRPRWKPLVLTDGGEHYLQDRLALLSERLHHVNELASRNELPGVLITDKGVKITPLETIVPAHAQPLKPLTSARPATVAWTPWRSSPAAFASTGPC